MVELSLSSTHAGAAEQKTIQAYVVHKIPKTFVAMGMDRIYRLEFVQGHPLADPEFSNTSKVDLLIGQAHTVRCELPGSTYSKEGGLKAQRTIFGWTVGGSIKGSSLPAYSCMKVSPVEEHRDHLLQQFWSIETVPGEDIPLTAAKQCTMQLFSNATTREEDMRYCVVQPKKEIPPILGESRQALLPKGALPIEEGNLASV